MKINDVRVSRLIVDHYWQDLTDYLQCEVAIVGGGPSGLVAGYYLATAGKKVALFERKLSIGGGMWGGGMMFNRIVVQDSARSILDQFGVPAQETDDGYHVADAVLAVTQITARAIKAGLKVFNLISVEDVLAREDRICGLVINWSPVEMSGLHVDPLGIEADYTIDATGHDAIVTRVARDKLNFDLPTTDGKVQGEKSLWAQAGERAVVENTRKVYPGLYVAGMAASAVFGSNRMGPIFGGMLLSGKKAADMIVSELD